MVPHGRGTPHDDRPAEIATPTPALPNHTCPSGHASAKRIVSGAAAGAGRSIHADAAATTAPARKAAANQSRGARTSRRRVAVASSRAAGFEASSISNRATPMSARRSLRSFARLRRSSRRIDAGVSAGSAAQSGSPRTTAASVSVTLSPANVALPVNISNSTQPNAQMSARLSIGRAARLLRRHVCRRAENDAHRRVSWRRHRRRVADVALRPQALSLEPGRALWPSRSPAL